MADSRTTTAGERSGAAITQVRNRSVVVTAAAAASAGNGEGVHRVSGISRLVQPCCSTLRTASTHSRPVPVGVRTRPKEISLSVTRPTVPPRVRPWIREIAGWFPDQGPAITVA